MAGLNIIASEGTAVRVSDDGGSNFYELPGIQSHSEAGGDLNQRQVKAFKGVSSKLSLPDVSTISVTAIYTPTHPAWLMVNKAARAGTLLVWEVLTAREEIFSEALASGLTVALSAPAVVPNSLTTHPVSKVVFDGADKAKAPNFSSDDFGAGMTLDIGARAFTIALIEDGEAYVEVATIKPANAAAITGPVEYNATGVRSVAAASLAAVNSGMLRIRTPQEYLRYTARTGKPPASLENEADMQTSFTVYPRTLLGDWLVRAAA